MDNELYHYGVPGMKWGVRRSKSSKSSGSKNATKGWNKDAKEAHRISKKNVKQMSNAELRRLNERQNLERQYSQLNPSKVKRGMAVAATVAGGLGTVATLYNNSNSVIKIGKTVAEKMMKR